MRSKIPVEIPCSIKCQRNKLPQSPEIEIYCVLEEDNTVTMYDLAGETRIVVKGNCGCVYVYDGDWVFNIKGNRNYSWDGILEAISAQLRKDCNTFISQLPEIPASRKSKKQKYNNKQRKIS